jgi:hypothetical protein
LLEQTPFMNLVNDLGSDIAMAFLFESKYREKLEGNGVVDLISRVRFVLEPTGGKQLVDAPQAPHSTEARSCSN